MPRDRDDRPSWSEIGKLRDKPREQRDRPPQDPAAKARAAAATAAYVKELDRLFSASPVGEEAEALAREVRDKHGTAELAPACRSLVEAIGLPRDPALLSLFLDSDASDVVVPALEGLQALQRAGELEVSKGLQSQLRVLAQSFDDDVAGISEEILEAFEAT